MDITNLVQYLNEINYNIIEQKNISIDDLKKLLLVSYNELLNSSNNIIIKSLLITTLYNFINLENEYQKYSSKKAESQDIISKFTFPKFLMLLKQKEKEWFI